MSNSSVVFADLCGFTALTEDHGDLDAASVAARFADQATRAMRMKNVARPVRLFELVLAEHPAPSGMLDPVCRMRVDPERAPARLTHDGRDFCYCSVACAGAFAGARGSYAG